jgi:CheY-like chemotaxis protein
MPHLPRPGQRVRWRDPFHAHAIGWLYALGPGPFEVVGVVDRSGQDLPAGLVLKTILGDRELSEVWMTLAEGKPCVLVVDDNRDAADSLGLLLSMWGHRPLIAYDATNAWGLAVAHRPAAALLDLGLPGTDGWELAHRLRAEPTLADMKLIAVTGHGRDLDRTKSAEAGFDLHLLKPVDPELLQRLLVECGPQRDRGGSNACPGEGV